METHNRQAVSIAFYAAASRIATVALLVLSSIVFPTHDASGVHKFRPGTFLVPGGSDIGRPLAAFTRWDSAWFLSIADNGYPTKIDGHPTDEIVECSGTDKAWGGDAYTQSVISKSVDGEITWRCGDDIPLIEQAHAFFPLYPWVIQWAASALRSGVALLTGFSLGEASSSILAAVAMSNACFVAAAVLLYHLGVAVMNDSLLAYRGALAFCATPAGVFFSTAYTESIFAALTFGGLLVLSTEGRSRRARREDGYRSALYGVILTWIAAALLSLATLTRSNGITAAGVFILEKLRWMADDAGLFSKDELGAKGKEAPQKAAPLPPSLSRRSSQGSEGGGGSKAAIPAYQPTALPWSRLVASVIATFLQVLLVVLPYALVQVHAYYKFCGRGGSLEVQVGPGTSDVASIHPWCHWRVPSLYAYVQSTYWGVGALKYYQWKQIPNILLATPVLLLTLTGTVRFFSAQLQRSPSSQLVTVDGEKRRRLSAHEPTRKWPRFPTWLEGVMEAFFGVPRLRHAASNPFERTGAAALILQWAFLGVFAAVYMNVQVATRFLAAACPPLHWWTAYLLFPERRTGSRNVTNNNATIVASALRRYMGLYFVVGAVLHANFLPWT